MSVGRRQRIATFSEYGVSEAPPSSGDGYQLLIPEDDYAGEDDARHQINPGAWNRIAAALTGHELAMRARTLEEVEAVGRSDVEVEAFVREWVAASRKPPHGEQ